MAPKSLPPVSDFRIQEKTLQIEALDALFEPSPAIHETLLPIIQTAQYSTWPEFIDACHARFFELSKSSSDSSPDPKLLSILGSHPRLGEKKITSAHAAAEQANLQKTADPVEAAELARLNREYEKKFPGLIFVVFVNGRGRPEIMENMRTRIARADFALEVDAALQVALNLSISLLFLVDIICVHVLLTRNRQCATLQRIAQPNFNKLKPRGYEACMNHCIGLALSPHIPTYHDDWTFNGQPLNHPYAFPM